MNKNLKNHQDFRMTHKNIFQIKIEIRNNIFENINEKTCGNIASSRVFNLKKTFQDEINFQMIQAFFPKVKFHSVLFFPSLNSLAFDE